MSTTHISHSRRFTRLAAIAFVALAGVLGVSLATSAPALAHDKLVSYSATDDAIRLTFNNTVLDVGGEIAVTDANGADVTGGAPEFNGPDVIQPLQPGLSDGEYTMDWRVVSSDGHPIQGTLVFVAEAGAITTIEEAGAEDDHDHGDESHDHGDEAHDHDDEGHNHGDEAHDHDEAASDASAGPGVPVVIAVAVGAAIVVAGVITALALNSRRKNADRAASEAAESNEGSDSV